MAQKKKQDPPKIEEETPQDPAQPVVHEYTCVMCRYLAQGDLGPTCGNVTSPFHLQRMREEDGCDSFGPKTPRH
jgi:hypothetical protein